MLRHGGIGHETYHDLSVLLRPVNDVQIARVYNVPDHRYIDQICHLQTSRLGTVSLSSYRRSL